MKIKGGDYVTDGPGSVEIIPDESDDLWLAYNLIVPGDTVMADTKRKVLREAASGSREAEGRKLKLEINVEKVDYDKEGSELRIHGKNITENEHVKKGQFHTLKLELHRSFILTKVLWDSLAIESLQQAADPSASADLAVVLMREGLAHIFLVGKSSTITRSRIKTSIPPLKHGASVAGYEKALNKFYENVLQAFMKHIEFEVVRCAVIASPDSTKDAFFRHHLMPEALRRNLRNIIENRTIRVRSSSGYEHSLREVLGDPTVMNLIKDKKAAQEVRALKDFFAMLTNHVEVAHERMAVQTLLITDELFRSADIATRKRYVNLVNAVKDSGGTAHVFSSMHKTGEQLAQLTGITAIL